MSEGTQRRLAAILAADVAGFSRLIGADEEGTLTAVRAHRRELIDNLINTHGGRVANTAGDSILMEFASAVDAVRCAIAVQEGMAERNIDVESDQRVEFRMGINVGDVVIEGDDLLGDGVNVAARLEGLSEAGGVALSANAFDYVDGKVDAAFAYYGEHELKNIARPVHVWRWSAKNQQKSSVVAQSQPSPLPDKPSIAVLPFDNMSGDTEQEYFSDGITEDIITELSRFGSLFVIARNSSFAYKGQPTNVTRIGKSLGVQFLVEGSVRKVGNRVRITAQLLNTQSGKHLWAERYDRKLDDIFEVQDDVVRHIAASVPGVLDRLAVDKMRRRPPSNLSAYDYELRGRWAYLHLAEGLPVALKWYEKAVLVDPEYAQAHAGLGAVLAFSAVGLGLEPETAFSQSKQHVQRAVSLDPKNPTINIYAGFTYHLTGEHNLARRHAERAVALNPNDPLSHYVQACALSYTGDPKKALDWFASSEQLEPYAPDDQRLDTLCDCYYMLGEYDKVFEIHAVYQNVPAFLYVVLAAAYAQAGRREEATAAFDEYERTRPDGHTPKQMLELQMQMCSRQDDRSRWREGYLKAGFEV